MIALVLAGLLGGAPADDIARAKALVDELSYAEALTVAQGVAADQTATQAEKIDAMFIEGYCLVLTNHVVEAQKVLADIFLLDVDARSPIPIEPKVEYLVDAARAERRKAIEDGKRKEREALQQSVRLLVHDPLNVSGGERADFAVDVTDPNKAVKSMRLDFIKEGEREPYGIPLARGADGTWRTTIPGTFTRSTTGLHIRWYITASDDVGELAHEGTRSEPRRLEIAPGSEVALDMKASERFSRPVRFVYALIGVPAITSAFFLAGLAVSGGYGVFIEKVDGTKGPPASFGERSAVAALAFVPPIAAAVGTGVSTQFLLDGSEPWAPTGAVLGAGAIYTASILFAGVDLIRQLNQDAPSNRAALGFIATGDVGAVVGAGLGLAAATIIPATMVGYENATLPRE